MESQELKRTIFLIGNTGVGKSTLSNWLIGHQLIVEEKDDKATVQCKEGPFIIGDDEKSQTRIMKAVEKGNTLLCDTPGFLDSESIETRMENAILLISELQNTDDAVLILVIEESQIQSSSGVSFKNTLTYLQSIFQTLEKIYDSCFIIINKSQQKLENSKLKLRKMFNENKNKDCMIFIKHILDNNRVMQIKNAISENNFQEFQIEDLSSIFSKIDQLKPYVKTDLKLGLDDSSITFIIEKIKFHSNEFIFQCQLVNNFLTEKVDEIIKGSSSLKDKKLYLSNIISLTNRIQCIQAKSFKSLSEICNNLEIDLEVFSKMEYNWNLLRKYSQFQKDTSPEFPKLMVCEYAQGLSQRPKITIEDTYFIIQGDLIRLSDIQNIVNTHLLNQNSNNAPKKQSFIIVQARYFVDADSDIEAPSMNLCIDTPVFIVNNAININLRGLDGQQHNIQAVVSENAGNSGRDGLAGRIGGGGGNLFLFGDLTIVNVNKTIIQIDLSGGKGGDGQRGQDGSNGKNGEIGNINDVEKKKKCCLISRKKYTVENKTSTQLIKSLAIFNGQFLEKYQSLGTSPIPGGNGGKGGEGGIGGISGRVFHKNQEVLDLEELFLCCFKIVKKKGISGKPGQHGQPGIGGEPGISCEGVYLNELVFPILQEKGKEINESILLPKEEIVEEEGYIIKKEPQMILNEYGKDEKINFEDIFDETQKEIEQMQGKKISESDIQSTMGVGIKVEVECFDTEEAQYDIKEEIHSLLNESGIEEKKTIKKIIIKENQKEPEEMKSMVVDKSVQQSKKVIGIENKVASLAIIGGISLNIAEGAVFLSSFGSFFLSHVVFSGISAHVSSEWKIKPQRVLLGKKIDGETPISLSKEGMEHSLVNFNPDIFLKYYKRDIVYQQNI